MSLIETAVFPVGGLGTRFLPITKSSPKEMLPIIDKPLIQHVVDEAVASGIKKLIFVTNFTKRSIEDYFDRNVELEMRLEQKEKRAMLAELRNIIPADVSVAYVRQPEPRGLGDALLCARPLLGDRPFAVLLADDVIDAASPCLADMISRFRTTAAPVVAVERVRPEQTRQYGMVGLAADGQRVVSMIEKPAPEQAPSDWGIIGRYILTPSIFPALACGVPGSGGELQLTDALATLLAVEEITAWPVQGQRFDCGSKAGWLAATLAFAAKRPDLAAVMRAFSTVGESSLVEDC